jgi:hypothetical protein
MTEEQNGRPGLNATSVSKPTTTGPWNFHSTARFMLGIASFNTNLQSLIYFSII